MFRFRCGLVVVVLTLSLVAATQAQVTLKPRLVENSKSSYEISQFITQLLVISGQELKTEVDTGLTVTYANGARDEDGLLERRVSFDSLRTIITAPGGLNVSYDSSINLAKADNDQLRFLLDVLEATKEARYTLKFDRDGKVRSVAGLQKVINKTSDLAKTLMEGQFTQENIKREYESEANRLPDGPVKVGDTWQRDEPLDLGAGQVMTVRRLYKYEGTEQRGGKTLHKLGVETTQVVGFVAPPNDARPIGIKNSDLTVAESKGSILYDNELGQEVENTSTLHIKGKLTLEANGAEIPSELDLKIEGTVRKK